MASSTDNTSASSSSSSSSKRKTFYCGHCNKEFSKTLYFRHKKQYYDIKVDEWRKGRTRRGVEEFTFESDGECLMEDDVDNVLVNDKEGDTELSNADSFEEAGPHNIDEIEIWFDDPDLFLHNETPTPCHQPYNNILRLYSMFLFMWQSLFRVSDTGISILFSFIAMFFLLLSKSIPPLKSFSDELPKNIDAARRFLGRTSDNFTKWVCCEKCSSLYSLDDAKAKLRNGAVSKKCEFIRYRNHPQRQHRKPCGHPLMKSIRTSAGSVALYPKALYCYNSVITSLEDMLQRPHFFMKSEQWRNVQSDVGLYHDIYDGQVWKDFMFVDGSPFLAFPYNYALTLNVDWFQPFKRSTYSAGVIYLAVQNLPRTERYLTENIILCGVIPGPKEPEKTINSFLEPLVHELQLLWKGVQIKTVSHGTVIVRAALICVACDIPAARKVCGFVGHNARLACSKCSKVFPTTTFGEKPDYSGFDRTAWNARNLEDHKRSCAMHKLSNTHSAQVNLEREHGCRYSVLLELPYFDPIRMTVIDPMHNLLLGTAKRMFTIWSDLQLIEPQKLNVIQDCVDNFITPGDVGRIPGKIASGFSGFTADQWRNWTTIFSLFSLKNVLPVQHFECWHMFVKACHLICRRKITSQELSEADLLLVSFCKCFEQLYGKEKLNINLHLHCHLRDCVLDYGPVYSFWLFSFERLNGIMESFSTNCKDVSLQLMRRFENIHQSGVAKWPEEFRADFASILEQSKYNKGSLMQSSLEFTDPYIPSATICALPPLVESSFDPLHFGELRRMFACTNLVSHEDYTISPLFSKCAAIKVGDYVLSSKRSRFMTCSHIMAKQLHRPDISLAEVQYYLKCDLSVDAGGRNSSLSFWLAVVSFYYPHDCKSWFGHPTEVWSAVSSPDCHFLPLSYIKCRVAYSKQSYNFGPAIGTDSILVVTPLALHH